LFDFRKFRVFREFRGCVTFFSCAALRFGGERCRWFGGKFRRNDAVPHPSRQWPPISPNSPSAKQTPLFPSNGAIAPVPTVSGVSRSFAREPESQRLVTGDQNDIGSYEKFGKQ
jgi:hypothetical protein